MKKKAKLVLPKIAEFQKDDEDISKGENEAKFPSYKRKFKREKKTLQWPPSDVLPPIRASGKLNLTCHGVGDGKTSGKTKWESVRPSTTQTTPHIVELYLRLRVKTESLPKSITIIGQKAHQNKVPKNTGTSANTEWPALSWKFPRRKNNTKAGHGRDMGELTCLLLITKTKLRERLPRVPIQDWVPGSVGIPTFHCRQCLQHWKMHGDLPEECDQPEQITLGPAIFLTHSTPQKEKIPIKNAYTESGTQLHVSVSGKEGEKDNDNDPLVSPKDSQESLKNLLWKGESIEEDSSSETLDSEESMCLHPTRMSSTRDSLRREQTGSSVSIKEPKTNNNHSVTLPPINTSIAHQRDDDETKTVNMVSCIRNTSGSKDGADKLSTNQGVQDKRTLQSSPVASGLQSGSGTRKFVRGAKRNTHSHTGHDHSDWQSSVCLDDKYKTHKHLQDDDKDSQDKTKTKFNNDVQLNTAEMPLNVTLSGLSDPQADSSHLAIKSKLKDHTSKQEEINNSTSLQNPSKYSSELSQHNTSTLAHNPDNLKNGTSTSTAERDSESKGNRSQSNEETAQFANTSYPTHSLHDGDTNTIKSDEIVSLTDKKPRIGHAQKTKVAKKNEVKTLHQAILKENVELPRKNMEKKKKRERKSGKKPNDGLNDHPRVVHSSKSHRGSFHIDPTASEETDGNHFNFSPSTALNNGSNVRVQSSALRSKIVRNMTKTHDVSVPSRHNSKDLKEGIVKSNDAYKDRRQSVNSSTRRPQSQLIRNNRKVSAQSNVSKDAGNSRYHNDPTDLTSYPKTEDGLLASTTAGSGKPNSQSGSTRTPGIHYQKNSSSHLPYNHTCAKVTSSRYSAGVKQSEEHRQPVTDVDSSGQNILPTNEEPDPTMSKNEPVTATHRNQSYNYETRQADVDVTESKDSIDSCNQDDHESATDREEAAIMEEYYATVKPAHFGLNSVSNFTPSFTYSMFPMSKQHRDRYDNICSKVHTLRHKQPNKQTIVRS